MDLVVGRVAKAHGVTGEVVVEVRTDDPDDRFAPGTTAARPTPPKAVPSAATSSSSVRAHGGRLLVRLAGVADRSSRRGAAGHAVHRRLRRPAAHRGPRRVLRPPARGAAGCDDRESRLVGHVAEVLHTAAGELLSVRRETGAEVLVPFVSAIVTSVSLADQAIEIDPPEGLLEL